jgi:hypothetical protein
MKRRERNRRYNCYCETKHKVVLLNQVTVYLNKRIFAGFHMTDPSNDDKALIKVSDLLGIAKGTDRLLSAIERGVGNLLSPWQIKRVEQAKISNFENWNIALQKAGLATRRANLTLEERASVRLAADDTRHQYNRERIAIAAAQDFKEAQYDSTSGDSELAPEWIDRFWKLSENITEENMQAVWGRILARQSNGSGRYSIRSLETLSMLSRDELEFLERLADKVGTSVLKKGSHSFVLTGIYNGILDSDETRKNANKNLSKIVGPLKAEVFGPAGIYLDAGGTSWAFGINVQVSDNTAPLRIADQQFQLRFTKNDQGYAQLGSGMGLSPEGAQIMSLIKTAASADYVNALKDALSAHGVELLPR